MFVRKYCFISSGGYCFYIIVVLFVVIWVVLVYFVYVWIWKFFNFIFGEIYEMVDKNGFMFLVEQVSLKVVCKFVNKEYQIELYYVIFLLLWIKNENE